MKKRNMKDCVTPVLNGCFSCLSYNSWLYCFIEGKSLQWTN